MTESQQQELLKLIRVWKLNKTLIADLAGINRYTFGMKLREKPGYTFTDAELLQIADVISKLNRAASVFTGMK